MSEKQKPTLYLIPGNEVTGEALDWLFERRTGRKVSPEESAKNRHFCEVEIGAAFRICPSSSSARMTILAI